MQPRSLTSRRFSLTSRQPLLVWIFRIGIPIGYLWAWLLPASGWLAFPCPFHWLTGWRCPGCGMGRATHALLHGQGWEAMQVHPLVLPFHLALLVGYVSIWMQGKDSFLFRGYKPVWGYVCVALVFASTLLLNL